MSMSLYSVTVPTYLQTLGAVLGLVNKAEAHCAETHTAPPELIQARLAEDMLPFAYQVKSTCVHSLGAIEGVRRGVFSPDTKPSPDTFDGLQALVNDTVTALASIKPEEIDGFLGRPMRFSFGERTIDFTAEDFLLSFSQPNFFFHATTAYDILRWKGLKLTKRDFTGRLRIKTT
jgi:uncharacterized protein